MRYQLLKFFMLLMGLALCQQASAQRSLYYDSEDYLSLYPDNMSFTCVVEENGSRILDCEVAAFDADGNLRGAWYSESNGLVFLMVQGKNSGDVIHFKVVTGHNTASDPYVIRDINETYNYRTNDIIGDMDHPYVFTVGEASVSPAVSHNASGYATYSSNVDVKIATAGVKAYKAVITGEELVLSELNGYIPAGTGVLLHFETEAQSVEFEAPGSSDVAASNLAGNNLRPTTTATKALVDLSTVTGTLWALSADNSFKRFTGAAFYANRAFLVHEPTGNATEMRIVFSEEGNATGIEALSTDMVAGSYDLMGRKSGKVGFQIRDGKIIYVCNK